MNLASGSSSATRMTGGSPAPGRPGGVRELRKRRPVCLRDRDLSLATNAEVVIRYSPAAPIQCEERFRLEPYDLSSYRRGCHVATSLVPRSATARCSFRATAFR